MLCHSCPAAPSPQSHAVQEGVSQLSQGDGGRSEGPSLEQRRLGFETAAKASKCPDKSGYSSWRQGCRGTGAGGIQSGLR